MAYSVRLGDDVTDLFAADRFCRWGESQRTIELTRSAAIAVVTRSTAKSISASDVVRPMPKRIDAPARSVSSDGRQRTEFCIGAGAHTHYWDRTAPTIAMELDRLIATSAYA